MIQANETALTNAIEQMEAAANNLHGNVRENDKTRARIEDAGGTVPAELRTLAYTAAENRLAALESAVANVRSIFDATEAVE